MKQFEVWVVDLGEIGDGGSEMVYMHPCVVVSPNDIHFLPTRVVVPMTTRVRKWPYRVLSDFRGKRGEIALEQIRCVDMRRKKGRLGRLDPETCAIVMQKLREMFSDPTSRKI